MTSHNSELILIEEYKQNREYLRHVEMIRLRHSTLLFLVVGALLTVLSYDSESSIQSLGTALTGLFVTLYATFLCAFIVTGKAGYDAYRAQNEAIKQTLGAAYVGSHQRGTRSKLQSPFVYWYGMVALIAVGSAGFTVYAFGVVWPGVVLAVVVVAVGLSLLVSRVEWREDPEEFESVAQTGTA